MANWISNAVSHPGALHEALNVPEGQKIPEKKLNKAENSRDSKLRAMANLAETLGNLNK